MHISGLILLLITGYVFGSIAFENEKYYNQLKVKEKETVLNQPLASRKAWENYGELFAIEDRSLDVGLYDGYHHQMGKVLDSNKILDDE